MEVERKGHLPKRKMISPFAPDYHFNREPTFISVVSTSQDSIFCVPIYYQSNFPSIFKNLGPKAASTRRHKKGLLTSQPSVAHPTSKKEREAEHYSFGEDIRKRNENLWLKIEAVAREKMEKFEKYSSTTNRRLRKQREDIAKKNEELLEKLRQQQQKKREEHYNSSSLARQWQHHRQLQSRSWTHVENISPEQTDVR